ncbi:GIY-YIG nuclease family protein [Gilvimarinus agarilyticus]|uniref:GIY-YIG nuclease family protein n=1 Tax=Gilvimarinus agarilyticus TaxID=679259 RepID=UPI001E3EDE7A|nr:GIY-YIG nuclease family protein [Gilvimarinus agarilyticus]
MVQRVWQHKQHQVARFTQKYKVTYLVYFEMHDDMLAAIAREKQIKHWQRRWKVELIETHNPYWRDLYGDIL